MPRVTDILGDDGLIEPCPPGDPETPIVLNHVGGHKSGVAGIYNRANYVAERTQALALWADYVAAVVQGKPSNVAPLRRA